MKYYILFITTLFIQDVLGQNKGSDIFFQEISRIQKGVKWIILNNGVKLSDSCDNSVLYFIFVKNVKKTKVKVAGDNTKITELIQIAADDSIMINWSIIDPNVQNQILIQPLVIKCDWKEDNDLLVSMNSFNAILQSVIDKRKNRITLLEPIDIPVGKVEH